MGFLKGILGKSDEPIATNADFWNWFQRHEKEFFQVVKIGKKVETGFINKLSAKLDKLRDGYNFLAGMYDDHTVELVLTADGDIKNIVFVEELIAAAPQIDGWKFTALKPPLSEKDINIEMHGYQFDADRLHFYSNDDPDYPDEIDLVFVHDQLTGKNKEEIQQGIFIFLDNYLGEYDFARLIDNMNVAGRDEAEKELIPLSKLQDYLAWREKEFIEKYEGTRYDTENDEHAVMEAELPNGNMLVAVINTQLLHWDRKASHPWVGILVIKYDGSQTNGMPAEDDYQQMDTIENEMLAQLSDDEGCLYIGRQTADGGREQYFAAKDFRKLSKVFYEMQVKYASRFTIEYEIYKDKYWRLLERFANA